MSEYERKERNANRRIGTLDLLARLKADIPAAFAAARVVGRWVWLEFDTKPAAAVRAAIKGLGFHWNRDREAWQHPCGWFSKRGPGDPRAKYGEVRAADVLDDAVEAVA